MTRDVTVLGIHDGHNAGAALVKDGSVVAAIQEERLVNIKNYSGTPVNSIKKLFEIAGIHPNEVDLIAIAGFVRTHAPLKERPIHVKLYERFALLFKGHRMNRLLISILHRRRKLDELLSVFRELGIENKEMMFVEHHFAHAACAYYPRPWDDETLVLTLDGAGDGICASVNIGSDSSINRIAATTAYNSPGNVFYSEITGYLGLKRWDHEYKIMGMAPYGIAEDCIEEIRKIVRVNPKKPLEFENTIGAYCTHVQKKLRKMLAEKRFDNISAATQKHFEDILVQWVRNAIKETGLHKVACAGGMFLNVKANKVLRELEEVEDIFFYPAAGDEGVAVGAALEAYHRFCEREGIRPRREKLGAIYYGMEYDNDCIERVLKDTGWMKKAEYLEDVGEVVAELLAKNKIIAVFNGRVEWGPRALGNRSILADPRDMRIIHKLNFAIKQRDFWMPFAPSILEERAEDYLQDYRFAPYMIEAFDTTEKADEIVAALHPRDRTARPHIVNNWNPHYRKILEAFEEITGVGGVLNTSFNLHGYPIVGTPEMAIWTFENSGLDGLAIGNWLVMK
jgi:carbamoyltransferase